MQYRYAEVTLVKPMQINFIGYLLKVIDLQTMLAKHKRFPIKSMGLVSNANCKELPRQKEEEEGKKISNNTKLDRYR